MHTETPRQSAPHDMISEMLVELVHEVPAASFKSKDDLKAVSLI